MSTLVTDELVTSIGQSLVVGAKSVDLYAICPYLYKHGNPSGSLYLEVRASDATTVLYTSETVTISSIHSSFGNTYAHGNVRFLISGGLAASTTYYIYLVGSGYTYDASAFIGWNRALDRRQSGNGALSGGAPTFSNLERGFSVFSYQWQTKG